MLLLARILLSLLSFIASIAVCQAQSNDRALAVGDSLFAVGNYSNAVQSYKTSKRPNYFKIAKAEEALGQDTKALQSYAKMLEEEASNVLGVLSYAQLLVATNRYKKGDSLLLNLLSKKKNNPNSKNPIESIRASPSGAF